MFSVSGRSCKSARSPLSAVPARATTPTARHLPIRNAVGGARAPPAGMDDVNSGGSVEQSRTREAWGGWGGVLFWGTFALGILSLFLISPHHVEIRSALRALGPLGPAAYFLAEIIQVVIIPIPGQPFALAGGWLLGFTGGAVIGSAGAIVGSVIAFHLARRFGREWVRKHVSGGVRGRVARSLEEGTRMEWIIFTLMMVPEFPRDPLCYLAGVSGMSRRSFVLIALLGRPVGLVPWVALGSGGIVAGVAWQIGMIALAGTIWLTSRAISTVRAGVPAEVES